METFFDNVATIIEQARTYVGRTTDLTMCITYYEIGRMIIEQEQDGKAHVEYGQGLMRKLADFLTKKFGLGFSLSTLKNARQFYQTYIPTIQQASFPVDVETGKSQTLSSLFENNDPSRKSQILSSQTYPFRLSWSHYMFLMRIENSEERRFYEIEAINQQWTFRQLQRQYGSSLYECLALSRNKAEVMRLANEGQTLEKPRDVLKNPLVLNVINLVRTGFEAFVKWCTCMCKYWVMNSFTC
ncbi:MAG: DUF1016 N-terminal domain-containing protein [Candidatus Bathyarchaeota archaeon]|uniref:DUF1016 N-terminal domain-containing protein n=1 Tax=Candidatus Bathycorpusculum sp. TaxID=2994959 RepID=UPI0028276C57|nr:DUF1016 N-terminal domain-containing protein [Candidatus Termiticorpusculum sp.]MCL2258151.1 DUF1016 N-terminal domain-containing protein [Candidatus Termiticorpusculum sp.]